MAKKQPIATPEQIAEGYAWAAANFSKDGPRYLGDGSAFVGGVPARDLTSDEWVALSDELRALCLATKLYDVTGESVPEEDPHGRERQ